MKIFLTIEFIALLIWVIAWARDVYHRSNYRNADGGFTTIYSYSPKIRHEAYNMSYFALSLGIVGVIYKIWF